MKHLESYEQRNLDRFLYDYSKKTQKSLASVMNLTFLTLIF